MDIQDKFNNDFGQHFFEVLQLLSKSEKQFHSQIVTGNYGSWDQFYVDINKLYPAFDKTKDNLQSVIQYFKDNFNINK